MGLCDPSEWELHYPRWMDTPNIKMLTIAQHRQLLKHLLNEPTSKNIGLLLAICTGMRIGKICALQWQDVDLRERVLYVHQSYGLIYNCDIGRVEKNLSTPKTRNANREIYPSVKSFFAPY